MDSRLPLFLRGLLSFMFWFSMAIRCKIHDCFQHNPRLVPAQKSMSISHRQVGSLEAGQPEIPVVFDIFRSFASSFVGLLIVGCVRTQQRQLQFLLSVAGENTIRGFEMFFSCSATSFSLSPSGCSPVGRHSISRPVDAPQNKRRRNLGRVRPEHLQAAPSFEVRSLVL